MPSAPHPLILIDTHADIPNPLEQDDTGATIDQGTAIDLGLLRRGGIGAVVVAASVVRGEANPAGIAGDRAVIEAKLAGIIDMAARHPDQAVLGLCVDDIVRAAEEEKTAIVPALLGAHGLGDDPDAVERLYRAGVRIFGMTHIGNTAFADSSRPFETDIADEHDGLSALGRDAVGAANRLGMLLDVSQLSTAALLQTVALSQAPVIATHSAIRALVDSPRNLTDEELDAIASREGMVSIVAFSAYLRNLTPKELEARAAITDRYGGMKNGYGSLSVEERAAYYAALTAVTRKAGLEDYLAAIDYAVARVGIDHVGLSSDFNQGGGITGWMRADEAPNVTRALAAHGYDEPTIAKLWGGNFLRVMREAERVAHRPAT